MNLISVLPFAILLLCIALFPLINEKFFARFYFVFPAFLSLIIIVFYISSGDLSAIIHSVKDYVMFISLLFALFTVSGGILIHFKGFSTPLRNVLILLFASLIANVIGTTGASMVFIRPFIRTNKIRITSFHIVFFIFLVSNIGGGLTPIGDPPLFLGYIKGIPFFWITSQVIIEWSFTLLILLTVFYVLDLRNFKKQSDKIEEVEKSTHLKPEIKGVQNIFLLLVIVGAVFITDPPFLREAIFVVVSFISYKITNKNIHSENHFTFKPIIEVAVLFLGIFITITPVLELLIKNSATLPLTSQTHYFWLTGFSSAILDNAPTYLTYLTSAMAKYGFNVNIPADVLNFLATKPIYVITISIASVFFGAMTYIGNGPNFMVKSIAEHQNVHTPSFIGYIVKYSLPILLPLFILIWVIFIL